MKLCKKHILLIDDLLKDENDFRRTCSPLLHCERYYAIVCDGDKAVYINDGDREILYVRIFLYTQTILYKVKWLQHINVSIDYSMLKISYPHIFHILVIAVYLNLYSASSLFYIF